MSKTPILLSFMLIAASVLATPVLAANAGEGHGADSKTGASTSQPDNTKQDAVLAPSAANEDRDDDEDNSFGDDSLDDAFDDTGDDF